MTLPIITYSARISDSGTYYDQDEIYGGTYTKNDPVSVDIQIWNNKFGLTEVQDLENFAINFYFSDLEDSTLLKYLKVVYNDTEDMILDIKDNVACATFFNSVVIKGTPNNGNESDTDNYIKLKVTFDATDDNIQLKSNDIKSLFVEIVTI